MKNSIARLRSRLSILVAVLAIFPAGASAAGGALDTSFGEGGSAGLPTTEQVLGLGQDAAGNLFATQPAAAGFQVTKLTKSGKRLSGYGTAGTAGFTSSDITFTPSKVAVYPDGRVLVLGTGTSQTLVRLTADGSVDTTFGTNGVRALGLDAAPAALAIGPEGSIVIAEGTDGSQKVVARLNADGTPDTGFANNGVFDLTLTSAAGSYGFTPAAVAIGSDSSVLVAGRGNVAGTTPAGSGQCCSQAAILKLGSAGAPDTSFGTAGVAAVTTDGTRFDSLAVAANGSIFAAGTSGNLGQYPSQRLLVAKFSSTGARDGYFGQVPTGFMAATPESRMAVGPTGGVVITGNAGSDTGANYKAGWSLARLDSQGAPDSSYGHSGSVGGALTSKPFALLVDNTDGAVVAASGQLQRYSATETPGAADTVDAKAVVNRAGSLTITARSPEGPNTTIECSIDNGAWRACPANVPADAGSHTALVRTHDASGEVDATPASAPFSVGPVVTIQSGPGANTTDSTPTFTFTSDAPATAYQCFVGDFDTPAESQWAACSGPAGSHTAAELAVGPHVFYVRGVVGGVAEQTPDSYDFRINAAAIAPSTSPQSGVAGVSASSSRSLSLKVPHRILPASAAGWARNGLHAGIRCSIDCRVTVQVEVNAATRTKLGLKSTVIALKAFKLKGGSEHRVALRTTAAVGKVLAAARRGTRINPKITLSAAGPTGQTARVSFH